MGTTQFCVFSRLANMQQVDHHVILVWVTGAHKCNLKKIKIKKILLFKYISASLKEP